MPLSQEVLGFTNRWYRHALETSQPVTLSDAISIQVITAPYFLGTKIEAFRNRGMHDFYGSRDLEDFVAVMDGRDSILEEIDLTAFQLRAHLAEAAAELLAESRFMDALPGYLMPDEASQQRLPAVLRKL
jgi:predicted nucleotidyltransferase